MNKIIDRLAEYIEFKHISLNAFDKSIGMSNGYIGKQIKNKASIGGDIIEKIACIHTELSIAWLITGKGSMIKEIEIHKVEEPKEYNPGPCEKCKIKDELIESLKREVVTLTHFNKHLVEADSPVTEVPKRKESPEPSRITHPDYNA